jgi:hypothetical protein
MLGLLGFLGPFIPQVLKWFQDKDDKAHEIEMFKLQMQYAQVESQIRVAEFEAQADVQEATALHQPQQSYGVQLLDAANTWAESTWGKFLITPAFYLFTFLDFVSGMVRPGITVAAFGFYVSYKWTLVSKLGVQGAWSDTDFDIVLLVLSYWFGHRAAKAAFGGNASTGYKNG